MKVLLVEDHPLTRDGLRAVLQQIPKIEVIGEAADGETAIRLARELKPDVIVMDIGLPACNGIEATRQIKSFDPNIKILMLTAHDLETEIISALAAGADCYCIKSIDSARIETALRAAAEGSAYLDSTVASLVLRHIVTTSPPSPPAEEKSLLSDIEIDVLRLIADGLSNQEIAGKLKLSVGTTKLHVREILNKLYVTDRTQAAVVALRKGLI